MGLRVRAWVAVALVVVLVLVAVAVAVVLTEGGPTTPASSSVAEVAAISDLSSGLSFSSNEEGAGRLVTYTFPLVNGSATDLFVRHVGESIPGLRLVRTPEWEVQRDDPAGSTLSETLTYHVGACAKIPRGNVDITLQARTLYGPWREDRISLMGAGTSPWQRSIVQLVCHAAVG